MSPKGDETKRRKKEFYGEVEIHSVKAVAIENDNERRRNDDKEGHMEYIVTPPLLFLSFVHQGSISL